MTLSNEIFSSLTGAWRLLLLDRNGMGRFNLSITGFWRSFFAAVLVSPAYFAAMGAGATGDAAPEGLALVRSLQYVAGWTVFPIIMIPVVVLMKWTDRYVHYIVAYNWSSVIMIALMLPVSLISQAFRHGQTGVTAIDALYFTVFLVTLGYSWFIARTALRIEPFTAVAIVLLDLITAIAISVVGNRFLLDGGSSAHPL